MIPSAQCRKFSREFKLSVINWARDNNASVEETAEKFQLARKRLREWMNEEKRIRSSRYGKQSKYSDVERARVVAAFHRMKTNTGRSQTACLFAVGNKYGVPPKTIWNWLHDSSRVSCYYFLSML